MPSTTEPRRAPLLLVVITATYTCADREAEAEGGVGEKGATASEKEADAEAESEPPSSSSFASTLTREASSEWLRRLLAEVAVVTTPFFELLGAERLTRSGDAACKRVRMSGSSLCGGVDAPASESKGSLSVDVTDGIAL